MPSLGIRMICLLELLAIPAGAILFYAVEGGSLWAALIIAALITCGTLLVTWWLLRKTGLTQEWSRQRPAKNTETDDAQ